MDSIIDRMIAEYDVNTWGSFSNHIEPKQTSSKLNPRPCATTEDVSVATAQMIHQKTGMLPLSFAVIVNFIDCVILTSVPVPPTPLYPAFGLSSGNR